MPCLDENTVAALIEQRLGPEERQRVDAHLDGCDACRELLADFARAFAPNDERTLPEVAEDTRTVNDSPRAGQRSPELTAGATVGRYVLLHELGKGGMGVVWAAFDGQLNRNVALKRLRRLDRESQLEAAQRLRREARAMARLSHPNVVAVHDLIEHDGAFFVAMELVEGSTLRRWLKERERPWREVLAIFIQAGRGLAAAHAAGLIHRDFKPENVLLGRDGVARVADFGLVRETTGDLPMAGGAAGDDAPEVTRTGVVVGTPAYMAPEQWAASAIDARVDQFSFCAALYLAIWGKHPFGGGDERALERAVRSGQLQPFPPGKRVPGWIRRALVKGLSLRPEDRFSSMEALLTTLETDPYRRARRLAWVGLGLTACVAVAAVTSSFSERREQLLCGGAPARLARVWSPERQERIHRAFLATGAPFAEAAFTGVRRALLADGDAWLSSAHANCTAGRLHAQEPQPVYARRETCLGRHLERVEALASVLEHADRTVVENAVASAYALPRVQACDDVQALMSVPEEKADPGRQPQLSSLEHELDQIDALVSTGQYSAALPRAEAARAKASALAHKPLEAEALHVLARTQVALFEESRPELAEATAYDAALAAEASHADAIAIDSFSLLVRLSGVWEKRFSEAHRLARLAQALLERDEHDPLLDMAVERELGRLAWAEGQPEASLLHLRRALEIEKRLRGEEAPDLGLLLTFIARPLFALGQVDEALKLQREAVARTEKTLGAQHPSLGLALLYLGNVEDDLEQHRAALESYQRALKVIEAAYGPDHNLAVDIETNLAIVLNELDREPEARPLAERALKQRIALHGPVNVDVAYNQAVLGELAITRGDLDQAVALERQAVATHRQAVGKDHPDQAEMLLFLGTALAEQHRFRDALEADQRALAILTATSGATTRMGEQAQIAIGRDLLGAGEIAKARARETDALAQKTLSTVPVAIRALAHFTLGAAMARSGAREQALSLVQTARDELAHAPTPDHALAKEIDRWLIRSP